MFEITVQAEFCAAHTITINKHEEPIHGHNWRVTAAVTADRLDHDGLLCDFHLVERELQAIIAPFINNNLNDIHPFTSLNPTAEHVAMHIGDQLAEKLDGHLANNARVTRVSITEAPGCVATYHR